MIIVVVVDLLVEEQIMFVEYVEVDGQLVVEDIVDMFEDTVDMAEGIVDMVEDVAGMVEDVASMVEDIVDMVSIFVVYWTNSAKA
jgi:methyl-accepting chemotaxis protein